MDWGSVPQWLTAIIAFGAVAAAIVSIRSQREIARKRAAIDFFVKTEMDKETLEAHKRYKDAVKALEEHQRKNGSMEDFAKMDAYRDIRAYLNLHELLGVGVNKDVFDDDVCYFFWSSELNKACRDTKSLVKFVQSQDDEKYTYVELVNVNERWLEREREREREKR